MEEEEGNKRSDVVTLCVSQTEPPRGFITIENLDWIPHTFPQT